MPVPSVLECVQRAGRDDSFSNVHSGLEDRQPRIALVRCGSLFPLCVYLFGDLPPIRREVYERNGRRSQVLVKAFTDVVKPVTDVITPAPR